MIDNEVDDVVSDNLGLQENGKSGSDLGGLVTDSSSTADSSITSSNISGSVISHNNGSGGKGCDVNLYMVNSSLAVYTDTA